jgi:hypothetical protein
MTNYLKAVFWDYPEFFDEKSLQNPIPVESENPELRRWFLYRFLENARVTDALKFFSLNEIEKNLQFLKLTDYSRKKWEWIIKTCERN